MSTIETISSNIIKYVHQQVNQNLLPAISDKYNIPLEELIELSRSDVVNIKAVPKTPVKTPAPVPTEVKKPISRSRHMTEKDVVMLFKKIEECREQNKFYNVTTGRPLVDSKSNRSKLKFFDKFNVAGQEGEDKLELALEVLEKKALEPLAPPAEVKKEAPKAVIKATPKKVSPPPPPSAESEDEDQPQSDGDKEEGEDDKPESAPPSEDGVEEEDLQEEENNLPSGDDVDEEANTPEPEVPEEPETPKVVPKSEVKVTSKKPAVSTKAPEPEVPEENEPEPPKVPKKPVTVPVTPRKPPVKEPEPEVPEETEPPKVVPKKPTTVREAKAAPKKPSVEIAEEPEPPKVVPKNPATGTVAGSKVKVAKPAVPTKVAPEPEVPEENEPEPPKVVPASPAKVAPKKPPVVPTVKEPETPEDQGGEDMNNVAELSDKVEGEITTLKIRFNKGIQKFWDEASGFVVKRVNSGNVIIGKTDSENKLVDLSDKDIKVCEKNGWKYEKH